MTVTGTPPWTSRQWIELTASDRPSRSLSTDSLSRAVLRRGFYRELGRKAR